MSETPKTIPAPTKGRKPSFDYAEATARFRAGETLADLAKAYGVTSQRMSQVVGTRRDETDEDIALTERVVAARLAGSKLREIAAAEKIGISRVSMIIQRWRRG